MESYTCLMKFVRIFTAPNEAEAVLLKGYLNSFGIEASIIADSSGMPIGGMVPTGGTTLHLLPHFVLVPKDEARRARGLLRRLFLKKT